MKLFTKIETSNRKQLKQLYDAFFEKYNEESTISSIGDETAEERVSTKLSKKVISTIGEIILDETSKVAFTFEKGKYSVEVALKEAEGMISEKTVLEEAVEVVSEEPEKTVSEEAVEVVSEETELRLRPIPEIPELEEILEGSKSFEEDSERIAKWIGLHRKPWIFKELVKTVNSHKNEKITWAMIETKSKDINYGNCQQQMRKKLKEYNMNPLKFVLKLIDNEKLDNHDKNEKNKAKLFRRMGDEVTILCSPEIVSKIDVNTSIDTRADSLLQVMGLEKFKLKADNTEKEVTENINVIRKVCHTAMKMDLKENDIKAVCEKAGISSGYNSTKARMLISQFVNDFARNHGLKEEINATEFLLDLQNTIILDEEIIG